MSIFGRRDDEGSFLEMRCSHCPHCAEKEQREVKEKDAREAVARERAREAKELERIQREGEIEFAVEAALKKNGAALEAAIRRITRDQLLDMFPPKPPRPRRRKAAVRRRR